MKYFLIIFVLAGFIAGPALAEAPPKPGKKRSLSSMEQELRAEKKSEKDLDEKASSIKQELESTKSKLVSVGKSIRKNEDRLRTLEKELADMEGEKDRLHASLEDDQKSMARLILALQRIRRLPPEALFARPGAPLETAQSAMLLSDIIPVLDKKATNLKTNLERLKDLTQKIRDDREDALRTSERLGSEQKEIQSLIGKREKLYASTREDLKRTQDKIQAISARSRNLRELIKRLDDERDAEDRARKAAPKQVAYKAPAPIPPSGDARLPISGILKTRFNEPDAFGAPSQGVTLIGRPGGLVVAPIAGVVRYSGHFKNYGNLVILEHESGYHSLIAGLEKIDTVVGRSVSGGEPIGVLKQSSQNAKPSLYYELRLHGRSVNPSRKFAELG